MPKILVMSYLILRTKWRYAGFVDIDGGHQMT